MCWHNGIRPFKEVFYELSRHGILYYEQREKGTTGEAAGKTEGWKMDTKILKCFQIVCEEKSLSRAAKRLYITPQG